MRKKNNARESAKISLAFSLAFILQIQPGAGPGLQRRPGLFGGIFCEVQRFLQKRAGFFTVFEYNIEDIVQI